MSVVSVAHPPFRIHPQALAYIERSIDRISNLSRTFQGESNTDVSALKSPLLLIGEPLSVKVKENFRLAVQGLLEVGPSDVRCESDAAILLYDTAAKVNEGLLSLDRSILRVWETGIKTHSPVEQLVSDFQAFAEQLAQRWHHGFRDPVAFSAWVEKYSNAHGHFFTDGCGRIARAFSTASLARVGLSYPQFLDRNEYFSLITGAPEDWETGYRSRTLSETLSAA